jgi:hypothetical protein
MGRAMKQLFRVSEDFVSIRWIDFESVLQNLAMDMGQPVIREIALNIQPECHGQNQTNTSTGCRIVP